MGPAGRRKPLLPTVLRAELFECVRVRNCRFTILTAVVSRSARSARFSSAQLSPARHISQLYRAKILASGLGGFNETHRTSIVPTPKSHPVESSELWRELQLHRFTHNSILVTCIYPQPHSSQTYLLAIHITLAAHTFNWIQVKSVRFNRNHIDSGRFSSIQINLN